MAKGFFLFSIYLLGWLLHAYHAEVLIHQKEANSILHRHKRYNTGLFEELREGNLERECIEEECDFEEAREVFEDDQKTLNFWKKYRGSSCSMYNGGCKQICENSSTGRPICSCISGYRLKEDLKSCEPTVSFPCGRITAQENTATPTPDMRSVFQEIIDHTPPAARPKREVVDMNSEKGKVPWQVYMYSFEKRGFCGGTIIHDKWIVTAAHCLDHQPHTIVAGEYNTDIFEHTEQLQRIVRAIVHPAYNVSEKYQNDIALLELESPLKWNQYVTPICLADKTFTNHLLGRGYGFVSGWWRTLDQRKRSNILQALKVHQHDQNECLGTSGHNVGPNVFCAGSPDATKGSYLGDSGGPYATDVDGTWFLTAISTCGLQCTGINHFNIYTGVGDHIQWIKNITSLL